MSRVNFRLRDPRVKASFHFTANIGRLPAIFLAATAIFLGLSGVTEAQTAQRSAQGVALPTLQVVPSRPSTSQPFTEPTVANPTGQPNRVPNIVAIINDMAITRNMLATECLRHYGADVLESVINKHLIIQACKARRIVVTQAEVATEIDRLSSQFGIPRDQWLKLLQNERGINPTQYANDIIWPTIALKKLAGNKVKITEEDLRKAFEHFYGERVRIRLITCRSLEKAKEAHAAATANPADFDEIAMKYSEDSSAGFGGTVPPVRRHGTQKDVEQAAFTMVDKQISRIFSVGEMFVIVKRENAIPAQQVDFEKAKGLLEAQMTDRRLRDIADQIFKDLQSNVAVQNVFNDPKARLEMPDVAAVLTHRLDGRTYKIPLYHLAEVCMQRYGEDVLAMLISRNIVAQEALRRQIGVMPEEIQREIIHVASQSLPPKRDGSPDVEGWLETVEKHQKMSAVIYREHVVWPRVALKKLVDGTVEVTEVDIQKGFIANYGSKVICRAIVLNNMRRAHEVWEMARKNPSLDFFGDLAEEYSIEGPTRVLRGEIPPISQNSGQPTIEQAAFKLQSGDLSGIIQIGSRFIILKCVRHLKAIEVTLEEVRDDLYADIFEKKEILAIDELFARLEREARIENYLSGTMKHSNPAGATPAAQTPMTAVRPSGAGRQ